MGRILTDKQAAKVAKQARKYDKSMPYSAKGITVSTGRVEFSARGAIRIIPDAE